MTLDLSLAVSGIATAGRVWSNTGEQLRPNSISKFQWLENPIASLLPVIVVYVWLLCYKCEFGLLTKHRV